VEASITSRLHLSTINFLQIYLGRLYICDLNQSLALCAKDYFRHVVRQTLKHTKLIDTVALKPVIAFLLRQGIGAKRQTLIQITASRNIAHSFNVKLAG